MGDNFNKCTFVECESSTIDCRIVSPGVVRVLFENVRNPIAVFPSNRTEKIAEKLKGFGYNYFCRENIIETALHNPNLIVHTIGGLMSIPRIEYSKGEYSMYRERCLPQLYGS
jgi:opine dehydrogenase